ncbi:hypothetical protein ACS0TY_013311 [Phlomoides rotata]
MSGSFSFSSLIVCKNVDLSSPSFLFILDFLIPSGRCDGELSSLESSLKLTVKGDSKSDLQDMMTVCIIMHNMIIEDERDLNAPIEVPAEVSSPNIDFVENEPTRFQKFLSMFREIRNAETHFSLRNALINHL